MKHWIFIASTKTFRMDEWLAENDFVEYYQRNKVCVGDIVYLYVTRPYCKIKYKMVVERINIPLNEIVDDSAYSTRQEPAVYDKDDKFFRLKLLQKTSNPNLHLDCLREHGIKGHMQNNFTISGESLEYVEKQFTEME